MIEFETSVHIHRPVEEVFAYLSEPLNFPRWNSAVQSVRKTSGREGHVGSTYSMERQLPTGRAVNELEVVARERSREFTIRTTSVVHVRAAAELGGAAYLLAPLARRAVKKGVDDNLATLKTILETHGN